MAKTKTIYVCQSCGTKAPKWMGRCTSCGAWNSFVEEIEQKEGAGHGNNTSGRVGGVSSRPRPIEEIEANEVKRIDLNDRELNRVLGGGIVPGSLVLFGGEPGIGKSTLMLQVALGSTGLKTLYVSGEESEQQIRMRAERIGYERSECMVLTETSTQSIFQHIESVQPGLLVVDSIQTLHSASLESTPGSISQIRECSAELMRYAKSSGTPVFLIGHITKEGGLAGPKVLEHMVDTVLQFEGDRNHIYRLLRTSKNRFGSTNELGIYEMEGSGLREVADPSEVLISNRDEMLSGVAIAATIEGLRPLLVEVQALVSSAAYGTPQRSATGFDLRRLSMLLAVLEKRCGFKLGIKDVFLNITGGMKVDDPAIDLAVVCAVLSSNEDIPVPAGVCLAAEVGLSGEIRPVTKADLRIAEAEKLGYEKIIVSRFNKGIRSDERQIEVVQVAKIEEVFSRLFG